MSTRNLSKPVTSDALRKLLAVLLCALPLFAEGGIQGVPPWPNQEGPNLVVNGDMEDSTGWTHDAGISSFSAGTGYQGSDSLSITGNGTPLARTFTAPDMSDAPWIMLSYRVYTNGSDGSAGITLEDATHSSLAFTSTSVVYRPFLQNGASLHDSVVSNAADGFMEVYRLITVPSNHGDGESWRIKVTSSGITTGTVHIDDVQVREAWYPLYSFMEYPIFHGYMWDGYTSGKCAGEEYACGFVDVMPPPGVAIADTYVEIHRDTVAGCPTPDATVTIQPTVQRTHWDIDLSSVAVDASAFICTEVRLDSDDSLVADFPDQKVIKRTTAWRAANLQHWLDEYSRWYVDEKPKFMWMTYLRFSSESCTGCIYTTTAGYESILGPGLSGKKIWDLLKASGRNAVLYFSPFSGADAGLSVQQRTPFWQYLESIGMYGWDAINYAFRGSMLGGDKVEDADEAASAPTITCSSTGGTISDANVYVKVAAVGGLSKLDNGERLQLSAASASDHETGLTGSTNSCVVTVPEQTTNEMGYWVYAEGKASESEPANGDYSLQTSRFVAPGRSITLTEIIDSQIEPLTAAIGTDFPGQQRNLRVDGGSWINNGGAAAVEDEEIAELFLSAATGYDSLLGLYPGDETTAISSAYDYRIYDYVRTNYPGRMVYTLPLLARSLWGHDWFFGQIVDFNAQDIYYESSSGTAQLEDWEFHNSSTGRAADCYNLNNATTSKNLMSLFKVDEWVDNKMRHSNGGRASIAVVQQFLWTGGTCLGFTEDELRKSIWKSIIAMQNWGNLSGVGTWGYVSILGMMRTAGIPSNQIVNTSTTYANTKALEDDIKVGAEMMAVEHMLTTLVSDSTKLGFGTVLDAAPTSSITVPTATCLLQGPTHLDYINPPIKTVAKVMPNGDQWILATNLCPDSQTMTFSLADATGKIATDYFTGETYTITSGDFSVSSTDFGVHVIKVETPKGGGIEGR